MKLTAIQIQRLLQSTGAYRGALDGVIGPKTLSAVHVTLHKYKDHIPGGKLTDDRKAVVAAQMILAAAGHEPGAIDGYVGHNTLNAYQSFAYGIAIEGVNRNYKSNKGEPTHGKYPTQSQAAAFYGAVGKHQTRITLPYNMVLAWKPTQTIRTMLCHEKVADDMLGIFTRVMGEYSLADVKRLRLHYFGGCLNVRKMRGGHMPSMHSYGAAVDIDPANNRLQWGRDRARLAQPEYEPFWQIVESAGAVSLGRARNFDWMHFQFARL